MNPEAMTAPAHARPCGHGDAEHGRAEGREKGAADW
jgi:hypothetical protein